MATASSKTGRVRGAGHTRGWRRRLRTCGIAGVVAVTVLLAAAYAVSWWVTIHVNYHAKNSTQAVVYGAAVGGGQMGVRVVPDRGDLAAGFCPGGVGVAVWSPSGNGTGFWKGVHLINLPWAAAASAGRFESRMEIPLALLVASSAWLITRRVRAARAARKGSCSKCGYDLTGLPRQNDGSAGVCPECGGARGAGERV